MKSRPTGIRIPANDTFAFIAGEQLYKTGPAPERDLYPVLGKVRSRDKYEAVQRGVHSGWLMVIEGGLVDCSAAARAHYDELAGKVVPKQVGKIAAPRQVVSAYDRPPLSKKYIPNPRGTRNDVPSWSVRTNTTFYTKA